MHSELYLDTARLGRSELEMVCRQAGVNPVWVTPSQRPSIECCSVAGNRHVEAYTER